MNDSGMGLGSEELGHLSALLDEVIDLGEPERERWFSGLKDDDLRLLPALRRLLSQASKEIADLLERGPTLARPTAR